MQSSTVEASLFGLRFIDAKPDLQAGPVGVWDEVDEVGEVFEDTAVDLDNPKDRIGVTKPPLELIPPSAELVESVVMGLGAKKYGAYNWRSAKVRASIYVAAARRHLLQWFDGQDNDEESGVSHLAHVRACMGIMLDALANDGLVDDRPPAGTSAELVKVLTETMKERA